MDELISREAAIKAICEDGTWLEGQGCTDISMAERKQRDADILSDLPSIDAVPVIRCKDCKHYKENTLVCGRYGLEDDDYCSWAERREE